MTGSGHAGGGDALSLAAAAIDYDEPELFAGELRWLLSTVRTHRGDDRAIVRSMLAEFGRLRPLAPAEHRARIDALAEDVSAIGADRHDTFESPLEGYPLAARYIEALEEGGHAVDRFVDDVQACGVSRRTLLVDVLARAQIESGCLWQRNELSIDGEGARTAQAIRIMTRLRAADGRHAYRGTIAAAVVPGEAHTVGMQMLCDLARADGWSVAALPAEASLARLVARIADTGPSIIALSASLAGHVSAVADTIAALRDHAHVGGCPIVVGGAPFALHPRLATAVGADATAADGADALDLFNTLATNRPRRLIPSREEEYAT